MPTFFRRLAISDWTINIESLVGLDEAHIYALQGAISTSEAGNKFVADQRPREPTLRRLVPNLGKTASSTLTMIQAFHHRILNHVQTLYGRMLRSVGPQSEDAPTRPSSHTVVWSLFAFIVFLIFASFAVRFPCHRMRLAFVLVSSFVICANTCLAFRDFLLGTALQPRMSSASMS